MARGKKQTTVVKDCRGGTRNGNKANPKGAVRRSKVAMYVAEVEKFMQALGKAMKDLDVADSQAAVSALEDEMQEKWTKLIGKHKEVLEDRRVDKAIISLFNAIMDKRGLLANLRFPEQEAVRIAMV